MLAFLGAHRNIVIAVLGFILWVWAYIWFFKKDLAWWMNSRKPHRWWSDLPSKQSGMGSWPKRPDV